MSLLQRAKYYENLKYLYATDLEKSFSDEILRN